MNKLYTTIAASLIAVTGMLAQSGVQSFTTSGVFIVPSGVTSIVVECVGAGGDGGGNGGGGGGGGAYASGIYTVTPGDTLTVNVGVGGAGPVGGTTSVPDVGVFATGGDNGTSVPNPTIGGGGNGGIATGGNFENFNGGNGGGGYWTYFGGGGGGAAGIMSAGGNGGNTIAWSGICQTPGGAAGISGGAPGGNGGKGAGFTDVNCNVTDPAASGVTYGGGGGGGNGNGGNAQSGASGYCEISWGTNAIEKYNLHYGVSFSPNPFTTTINVKNANRNEWYELMNATGVLIWSGNNISSTDFSFLAAGIYIVRTTSENHVQTSKLIKQ